MQSHPAITAFPIVHEHEGGKPIEGRADVGVVDHFALGVDIEDEALRQWITDLVSRGLEVPSLPADQPRSVCLRTPDGQVVELVAALPGRTVDATARDSDHHVRSLGALASGVAAGECSIDDRVFSGNR